MLPLIASCLLGSLPPTEEGKAAQTWGFANWGLDQLGSIEWRGMMMSLMQRRIEERRAAIGRPLLESDAREHVHCQSRVKLHACALWFPGALFESFTRCRPVSRFNSYAHQTPDLKRCSKNVVNCEN